MLFSPVENQFRPTGMAQPPSRSWRAFGGTRFVLANGNPDDVFAESDARSVSELIGHTELIVTCFGRTRANLGPAQEALTAAKALFAAQAYPDAAAKAEHAAALAVRLNDRFNRYMAAWKSLQSCMDELRSIGFPTQALEAALSAADKEVAHQVAEDDTLVPNYLGATDMLERATDAMRVLLGHARAASRGVLLASLAVEALATSPAARTTNGLVPRLERMIELATRELALGHVSAASKLASHARARADAALAGASEVWEVLDMANAILDGLETTGEAVRGLKEKIAATREALGAGSLDWTMAMEAAGRLSDEVASFTKLHPKAWRIIRRAEAVYARLREEGFRSKEVDAAFVEAQRALDRGDWAGVREKVGDVSQSFVRLRADQGTLTRSITELDARVTLLKDCRLTLMPKVEEALGRAKVEVRTCQLSGAGEDLMLATALMLEATRSGSGPA